jgi:hypothetical protein
MPCREIRLYNCIFLHESYFSVTQNKCSLWLPKDKLWTLKVQFLDHVLCFISIFFEAMNLKYHLYGLQRWTIEPLIALFCIRKLCAYYCSFFYRMHSALELDWWHKRLWQWYTTLAANINLCPQVLACLFAMLYSVYIIQWSIHSASCCVEPSYVSICRRYLFW